MSIKSSILIIVSCLVVYSNAWPWLKQKKSPLVCGAHKANNDDRYQDMVTPGELPFVVELKAGDYNKSMRCSGVIISSKFILTSLKCLDLNKEITVQVGSIIHGKGQKVEFKNVSKLELSDEDCCGRKPDNGLALLELRQKMNFTLEGTSPLNSVCLSLSHNFPEILEPEETMLVPSWVEDGKCQKVFELRSDRANCNSTEKNPIGCASSPIRKLSCDTLQEGAPIIHYLDGKKTTWSLIGIHSRNYDQKYREITTFIPLHSKIVKDWLADKLY